MKLNRVTHANEWWWLMIKRRLDSHERWILKICQKSIRQLTRNTQESGTSVNTRVMWHILKFSGALNSSQLQEHDTDTLIQATTLMETFSNDFQNIFFYLKCFLFLDIFFFSCELNIWRYFHSMKKFVFDGAEICAYTYVKKGKVNV